MSAVTQAILAATTSTASLLTETEDWAAACSAEPSAGRKTLVDALIRGLKADGVWDSRTWLLLLATEAEQAGRVNLVNPSKVATNVNSCTFTPDRGFTGDGISMHISLGEALDGDAKFTVNSGAFGVWCNQDNGGSTGGSHAGTNNGGRGFIIARRTPGNETFEVNDSTASVLQGNTGSRLGHRAASRTGAAVKRGFFNGARVADLTTASTLVSSTTQYILRNQNSYSVDRVAAFWAGGGLSDAGVAAMHARINTYLAAIGAA